MSETIENKNIIAGAKKTGMSARQAEDTRSEVILSGAEGLKTKQGPNESVANECQTGGCSCSPIPLILTGTSPVAPMGPGQALYRIENMDCPTEESLIRKKLEPMDGITGLDFNLTSGEPSARFA